MWAEDKASQALGMRIEKVGPGHAVLSMTVGVDMVNGHGLCHGGYIFTLADSALAFASSSHNRRTVAQHCQISYVTPGRLGMRLIAEARERHKRRAQRHLRRDGEGGGRDGDRRVPRRNALDTRHARARNLRRGHAGWKYRSDWNSAAAGAPGLLGRRLRGGHAPGARDRADPARARAAGRGRALL